jgi:hypothetical protein
MIPPQWQGANVTTEEYEQRVGKKPPTPEHCPGKSAKQRLVIKKDGERVWEYVNR